MRALSAKALILSTWRHHHHPQSECMALRLSGQWVSVIVTPDFKTL